MGELIGLCVSGFDQSLTPATSQTTHLRHERIRLTLPPNLKATRASGRARHAWWAEKAHSGTADQEVRNTTNQRQRSDGLCFHLAGTEDRLDEPFRTILMICCFPLKVIAVSLEAKLKKKKKRTFSFPARTHLNETILLKYLLSLFAATLRKLAFHLCLSAAKMSFVFGKALI